MTKTTETRAELREALSSLADKWEKDAAKSRKHWLRQKDDDSPWAVELQTNMNDLKECAAALRAILEGNPNG